MTNLIHCKNFLQSQKLLSLSTCSHEQTPWIANMYYSTDEDLNFYVLTSPNSKHGKHILSNSKVAISVAWFDPDNLSDRKGVQILAKATQLKQEEEIEKVIIIHLAKFPGWKDYLSLDAVLNDKIESKMFKFTPEHIKYWDDELFGDKKIAEINI